MSVRGLTQVTWLRMPIMLLPIFAATVLAGNQDTPLPSIKSTLEVRTDISQPVPGAGVLLEWTQGSLAQTSDAIGRIGDYTVPFGEEVVVTIGETRTPLGSTIGQVILFSEILTGNSDGDFHGLRRFVPEARSVHFLATQDSEMDEYYTEDLYSDSWDAHPRNPSPSYDFHGEVGLLRNGETVDSYFAYHQTVAPQDYVHGLLIRLSGDVDLGDDIVVFAIDREDNDYTEPDADVVQVTESQNAGLAAIEVLAVDSNRVYVAVSGTLSEGDNVVLISSNGGSGGITIVQPLDPVTIPPGGVGTVGGGQFEPEAEAVPDLVNRSSWGQSTLSSAVILKPNPDPACHQHGSNAKSIVPVTPSVSVVDFTPCTDCPAPADNPYCPDRPPLHPGDVHDCGVVADGNPIKQYSRVYKGGTTECNPGGITSSKQVCWTTSGGLEIGFTIGGVFEEKYKGGISKTECQTINVAQCTCVCPWVCDWLTAQRWRLCKTKLRFRFEWPPYYYTTYYRYYVTAHAGVDQIQPTTCQLTQCP